MATEDVTTDVEATPEGDFEELDELDWLSLDEAFDSNVDPDEPPEEEEHSEVDPDEDDEELFTLKVGGADKQVTREEIVALAQQGEDYTRKTQELAQQRETLQPLADLAQNLDADPEATLRWLAEQYGVDLTIDPEVEDPRDRSIRQMQAQLQQVNQSVAVEAAKREIQADLNRLEGTHGQFDREALIQFAAENRLPDLDQAYLAWVGKQALADRQSAATRDKTAQKHKAREVVEVESSRREKASVPATTGRLTVKQAFEAAAREAGHTRSRRR